jgi:hypothetical protein
MSRGVPESAPNIHSGDRDHASLGLRALGARRNGRPLGSQQSNNATSAMGWVATAPRDPPRSPPTWWRPWSRSTRCLRDQSRIHSFGAHHSPARRVVSESHGVGVNGPPDRHRDAVAPDQQSHHRGTPSIASSSDQALASPVTGPGISRGKPFGSHTIRLNPLATRTLRAAGARRKRTNRVSLRSPHASPPHHWPQLRAFASQGPRGGEL